MDPESKWKMATIENSELREMGNAADLLLAEPLLAADPGPPQDPLQQVHTNDSPMGVRNGHYEIFWGTLHPSVALRFRLPFGGIPPYRGRKSVSRPSVAAQVRISRSGRPAKPTSMTLRASICGAARRNRGGCDDRHPHRRAVAPLSRACRLRGSQSGSEVGVSRPSTLPQARNFRVVAGELGVDLGAVSQVVGNHPVDLLEG